MRYKDGLGTLVVVPRSTQPAIKGNRLLLAVANERQPAVVSIIAACAAFAVLALAVAPYAVMSYPHERGQRLLFVLLVCGPVVLLRRWALAVLAVVTAATGLVVASGAPLLPLSATLGLAAFLVATRLPRRQSMAAVGAAMVALGVALVYAAFEASSPQLGTTAVEGFLPLGAAWFVGDSVATRRRYVAGLVQQAERERAVEIARAHQEVRDARVRIAHELHDVLAHTLAVITVQAGVGRRLMAKRPAEAANALESIELIGRAAQDELRAVLGLLREEEGDSVTGLVPAPKLIDLDELLATVRSSGTSVEFRLVGSEHHLSAALELTIYRIVQEALTNVVKHAPGAHTTVELAVSAQEIRIEVADDGGLAALSHGNLDRPVPSIAGHGIAGMRERVGAFGGRLIAEPCSRHGFRVFAQLPIGGPG